ncbi:putative uncharacterized protein DDB_G0282133 [Wyeomyia smithii]|uniref:putative uncharacterized protein DDB_G0282133 n=1 Tax=Wyeomyia smithii TaxID=174621 RepID=UPI002467EDCE|nr:putative uncharacterized protein DDB_G0282133 [Wyeomyia smithii]
MMQNDQGYAGLEDSAASEPLDDFQKLMKQLQEMKEKPLFNQEESKEVQEDDDLLDDDYEEVDSLIRRQKQRDEENRKKLFDDDDDDYYDDYSNEDLQNSKKGQNSNTDTIETPSSDGGNVMRDYIKGKTASHRFKSRLEDFADGDDELLSSGSRKLRKNDSIKVISTPNGKVGIVYKVEPKSTEDDKTSKKSSENQGETVEVKQKITPVITADGKVALLYRGASDNSETFRNKYEPITDKDILTQLIDNNNSNNKNATINSSSSSGSSIPSSSSSSSSSSNINNSIKNITTKNSIYNSNYDSYDSFSRNSNNVIIEPATVESDSIDGSANSRQIDQRVTVPPLRDLVNRSTFTTTATMTITTTTIATSLTTTIAQPSLWDDNEASRQENALLINRPLSEVLGIKKNLYLDTSIKIPNIETSTHKMRITNNSNLLSSLLHSINGSESGTNSSSANSRIISNYVSKNFRNNANVEYDDRLSLGDRGGYSVNGFSRSRFYVNRRTTPPIPPRVIKEESEEEWVSGDDNSVPEVINLAIIPAFEHEIDEKYLRPNGDDHYYRKHRHHYNNIAAGHPTVHCAMQVVVACVVMGTFFGIAGAFFRSRVIDQLRALYW